MRQLTGRIRAPERRSSGNLLFRARCRRPVAWHARRDCRWTRTRFFLPVRLIYKTFEIRKAIFKRALRRLYKKRKLLLARGRVSFVDS